MTVLDILETASLYLGKREEFDYYFNEDNSTEPTSSVQAEFDLLLKALNLIVLEITSEFLPVEKEEEITLEDNKGDLSDLTETVNRIIYVKKDNRKRKFKVCGGKILANFNGTCKVRYSYIPNTLDEDDDLTCFDELINKRTLCFGVVMEYLYLKNLLDEVSVWEERFYSSLKNSVRKLGPAYMPKRRWL